MLKTIGARSARTPGRAQSAVRRERGGAFYFGTAFLITALAVLVGFIVIGVWPFGNGTVLIIDSIHQYLPFYTEFHEKLRSGSSLLYSYSGGLGYNFWSTYAYYLASPLNFLIALVPTENVCDFMDLIILLKMALCGGTFSWYLHDRAAAAAASRGEKETSFLPVVFGCVWGLSYFLIGYYFNLMWLDSIAMLPLIMRGIEKIRSDRSGWLYGLSLFYGLWCNYYIGFMLCLFSVLYFLALFLVSPGKKFGTVAGRIGRFAWYSLLAGGMSAAVLYPAFRSLMGSESMQNNRFPTKIKFYTSFLKNLTAHFALLDPINVADTQVGLNAYCTVAVFALIVLYLLDKGISLRQKLARFALLGIMQLSVSMNILNYIWHGFHQQNGLPNRFAFIYIALLLVMCHDALRHLPGMDAWRVVTAGIAPVIFAALAWIFQWGELETKSYAATLILLIVYLFLLLLVRFGLRTAGGLMLIGSMMLAEAAGSAVYGIIINDNVTRSIYLNDQKSFRTLTAETGDTSWYRSEIDSQRMRNVTMFAGGHAVVMFNSTMQASVTEFCDRIGMEARTNKNGYNGVTSLMNDVLGIKYVLSSNGKGDTLYQFEKIGADDNLTIYENADALPLAYVVNPGIVDWDITAGNPPEVQNAFVELATGLDGIYTLDRYVDMEDGETYGVHVPDNKQVYLYLPTRVAEIVLDTPEYKKKYTTFTDHLYVINSCGDETEAEFTTTIKNNATVQASIYTCPDAAQEAVTEYLAQRPIEDLVAEGNQFSGHVTTDTEGVLLITVPYDTNWHCTVDGEEAEALCIGSALMGLELQPGTHSVEMVYIPDGLKTGILLSLLSAALFIASVVWRRRRYGALRREFLAELTAGSGAAGSGAAGGSAAGGSAAGRSAAGSSEAGRSAAGGSAAGRSAADSSEAGSGAANGGTQAREKETRMIDEKTAAALREIAGAGNVTENEKMSAHTTFRIGGPADLFVRPATAEAAAEAIRYCRREGLAYEVIGNGSNLLVGDGGIRGVVIQLGRNFASIEADAEQAVIRAQAGATLAAISQRAASMGLTGLEFASGIPGTLGGAVAMNAGAYGGEMKLVVSEATVLDRDGEVRTLPGMELQFGYRTSRVLTEGLIVLEVKLQLTPGNPVQIRETMEDLKERRTSRQPLDRPSAGSTFKRPAGNFAGKLIQESGLMGYRVGDAMVSDKHAGFVVNMGQATAADVAQLISNVQAKVYDRTGVKLEPEVRLVGEF